MASAIELHAAPRTQGEISRFGGGDTNRAKSYLLALYGFLASKPDNTRRAYQYGIREFFEIVQWRDPADLSVAEAAYYKKWLRARGLSDATICQRLAACQSFFDFLMQPEAGKGKGLIVTNPFRLVTRKDCTPTPYGRSVPTEWDDFERVLKTIPDDAVGKRDRALLIFFAYTGRRRAEVANLRVGDLNLTSSPRTYTVKVKGGKLQTYELADVCHDAILDHWISSNRLSSLKPTSAVFGPTGHGPAEADRDPHRCLTTDAVAKLLKRNVRRAGLDPSRFKLHGLRHMFAHDLDAAGARLQDIQTALGHANVNTTQIYANKLRGPAAVGVAERLREIRKQAAKEAEDSIK